MISTTMMMLRITPNAHPAITTAMLEEDPPLSVCVLMDGNIVAVIDTNDEAMVLVTK